MSEKTEQPKDKVKLDVETILLTTEGRHFIKQIQSVSRILLINHSEVTFKGEEMAKLGYVGDCKSVQLFKCPDGYFLFCNKAMSMNNWSAVDASLENLLNKVYDPEIKEKVAAALKPVPVPAE